ALRRGLRDLPVRRGDAFRRLRPLPPAGPRRGGSPDADRDARAGRPARGVGRRRADGALPARASSRGGAGGGGRGRAGARAGRARPRAPLPLGAGAPGGARAGAARRLPRAGPVRADRARRVRGHARGAAAPRHPGGPPAAGGRRASLAPAPLRRAARVLASRVRLRAGPGGAPRRARPRMVLREPGRARARGGGARAGRIARRPGRVHPRLGGDAMGVVAAGVSGRRHLCGLVPPLGSRPAAVGGRRGALRPRAGAGDGAPPGRRLRRAPARPARALPGRARPRGPGRGRVRHRASRPLVVGGAGVARGGAPAGLGRRDRARDARRGARSLRAGAPGAAALHLGRGARAAHLGRPRRRRPRLGGAAPGAAPAARPRPGHAGAGGGAGGAGAPRRAVQRLGVPRRAGRRGRLPFRAGHGPRPRPPRRHTLPRPSGPEPAQPGARPQPRTADDAMTSILMLSWEYPPLIEGGLARHVRKLSEALVEQGVDVHVLTRGGEESPAEEVAEGVAIHRVREPKRPTDLGEFVAWVERMNADMLAAGVELGDRLDFDLVHGHDWLVAMAGDHLARRFAAPLVTTIHATEHGRHQGWVDKHPQSYIHGVERWIANRADRVIVCSFYMREQVAEIFGVPRERVEVIWNGIDPEDLQPHEEPELRRLRAQFAAPDEKLVLLIGRLVYEKGFQLALAAMPRLIERHPETRFLVAGSGT